MAAILDDLRKRAALLGQRGALGLLGSAVSAGGVAVMVYRFGIWAKGLPGPLKIPFKVLYFVLFYVVQGLTGISVQAYAKIGRRFVVLNRYCVFIVAERIGDDFTVCQGVTVGNVRGAKRLPIIGSNVFLEPGCKVLGGITIGDNVIVRANSLVLDDVPDNAVVAGNPARVLKRGVSECDEAAVAGA